MNIELFLSALKEKNINVRVDGEKLHVTGLSADVTGTIAAEIRSRKEEILQFFRKYTQKSQSIPVAPASSTYPLSWQQRQMWLATQAAGNSAVYNIFFVQEYATAPDLQALDSALEALMERHAILRTVFRDIDGEVCQYVTAPGEKPVELRVINATADQLPALEAAEANYCFDLTEGPLLRVMVVRLPGNCFQVLFTVHHIIFDGWSTRIFLSDLAALYRSFAAGAAPQLQALPIQYGDFASWQQAGKNDPHQQQLREFWLSKLDSTCNSPALPADKQRPAIKTYNGGRTGFTLAEPHFSRLKQLCGQNNYRMFSALISAFSTLLYKYTGETDFTLGLPVAGRSQHELQNQVGYYVNMVVLRTVLNPAGSFDELAGRVEGELQAAYEHQEYPFDQLVEDMGVAYDASRSPLFNILVNYTSLSQRLAERGEESSALSYSKFELDVDFFEFADGISVGITFNSDIFSDRMMQELAAHLQGLLISCIDGSSAALDALHYTSAEERTLLQQTFNSTAAAFDAAVTVVDMLEAQVSNTPDAPALAFENTVLDFKTFNTEVNRLAAFLREVHNVAPGCTIGVMLSRSAQMVTALYAIIKAGAAYVPIDPAYPLQRRLYMAADSNAVLVLTEQQYAADFDAAPCVCLDVLDTAAYSSGNPQRAAGPADPAYMIYTSGSTGNPKGVLVPHSALSNFCCWAAAEVYHKAGAPMQVALVGTINFDASIEILFPSIIHGSCLHIIPQAVKEDAGELLKFLAEKQIGAVDLLPSHLQLLLNTMKENQQTPDTLRYVLTGGEVLQPETCRLFFEQLGNDASLLNGYGPTETCINATCNVITGGAMPAAASIGRPLANVSIYILDNQLNETGIGVHGEIYIAGAGLATGYWNREALTAEKFITHPRLGRLYKSGDTGCWSRDGQVLFYGRIDSQVKVRGFRIELGEIERIIAAHEAVEEAVVLLADPGGDNELAAFVVWKNGEPAAEDLKDWMTAQMPQHMIPAQVTVLPAIPRMINGKTDRSRLQELYKETAAANAAFKYSGASNFTEQKLIRLWQEILQRENINTTDNFFEIGGHSLKAMRMVSLIQKEFSVKVNIKDIFQHVSVEQLAKHIGKQKTTFSEVIEVVESADYYPLSPGQRGLWLIAQNEGSSGAYNMIQAFYWDAVFDQEPFEKAWVNLFERHEILRTVFVLHEGNVMQQILPAGPCAEAALFIHDLRSLTPEEKEWKKEEIFQAERYCRYDLEKGPLMRLTVLRMTDEKTDMICGMHHIISDAWSLQVLYSDMMEYYTALRAGREANLPPLRIQYKDYAAWQNGRNLTEDRTYWHEQLKGDTPVLNLPSDYMRSAKKGYNGNMVIGNIGKEKLDTILELCRREDCSLFTLFLAVAKVMLYRYTAQKEIAVGIPVAGRGHDDLLNQVGYYVNAVVLKSQIDEQESFGAYLSRVKYLLFDAYEHQLYPFDRLVDELDGKKGESEDPLFNVLVNYEKKEGILRNVSTEVTDNEIAASRFDLTLDFIHYENAVTILLTHNTDLFKCWRMQAMFWHLQQLLDAVVTDITTTVSSISYMNSEEQQAVVQHCNNTAAPYEKEKTIQQLFEEQVSSTPGATALVHGSTSITYDALNSAVNRLANCLRDQYGIQPGDRVGVMMERSDRLITAILAIIKSGAAYVPIDPAYPAKRRNHIVDDSGMQLIITEKEFECENTTLLRWEENVQATCSDSNPALVNTAGDPVYIIYTSGSTGNPKGVLIPHQALNNLSTWLVNMVYSRHRPSFRAGLTASVCFDASAQQIFPALLSGASLQVFSEEERMNPVQYLQAMQQGGTEIIDVTPSFLLVLLQAINANPTLCPAAVKYVLAGGEILSSEVVQLFRKLLPDAQLINVYGPTETCVDATYKVVDGEQESYLMSIGRPVPNVKTYIVDEFLQPVGTGIFGELLIGGDGLAIGYNNNDTLTAEKFIEHPQYGRLYRTGDFARWSRTGEIEFAGRADGQVKLNGHRIELTEIENALRQYPEVNDCAVLVQQDNGAQRLAAFVIWKQEPAVNSLLKHLRGVLPGYMVPASFTAVDVFPKTNSGKIDRKALLANITEVVVTNTDYVAPQSATQQVLAGIWQELLEKDAVGIDDDFWEMGGQSLKAMRMMVKIYSELNVEVSVKDIFLSKTIRSLSRVIDRTAASKAEPITKLTSASGLYPISNAQKRLWIIDRMEGGTSAYNIVDKYTISTSVNETYFTEAVKRLAARHEILRTVFTEHNGEVMQKVIPAADFIPAVSFFNFSITENRDDLTRDLLYQEYSRCFSLEKGPLFTIQVIKLQTLQTLCVLNMHHIISDAWSIGIFKKELAAAYQDAAAGVPAKDETDRIQYKDYAGWLNSAITGNSLARDRQYWQELLAGELPVADVPADYIRPAQKTYTGRQTGALLKGAAFEQLKKLAQQQGSSVFTMLLSGLSCFLHRYTRQDDIIIGVPVAGRERPELDDQIGFYVNLLPFRVRIDGNTSFNSFAKDVETQFLEQLTHQMYPFDQMVEDIDARRDLSRSPIFDILINHQSTEASCGDGAFSGPMEGDAGFSKYDLTFDFTEFTDGVLFSIVYNPAIFSNQTADRMLKHFVRLVEEAVTAPSLPLAVYNYTDAAEKLQLETTFSGAGTVAAGTGKNAVLLLEEKAAAMPAAPAIVFGETVLSYAELNAAANRVAHYLGTVHGIGSGSHVAVMLGRSERMIVTLFGILKAGAAYVPVDPAYPLQRRQYMITDSNAVLVMTEKDYAADTDGVCVNCDEINWLNFSNTNPAAGIRQEAAAYMIYTSGSTGKPKGVLIEHRSLSNLCTWYGGFIAAQGLVQPRIMVNASISFDVSVGQIFGTLTSGAALVVVPDAVRNNTDELAGYIAASRTEVLDITPSFLHTLLLQLQQTGSSTNLTHILAAGEKLTADTCSLTEKVLPGARLYNLYGPTEACVYATMEEVKLPVQPNYRTIGKPLAGTSVYVLDTLLQPVGTGVWGELYIGGDCLARGYWNREDLTAERFIKHAAYGRLYKTGDVARWNSAGLVEYSGRADSQVKIRGYRIELSETEQVIQAFEGVKETVVAVTADSMNMLAFVVWESDDQTAALTAYLQTALPGYMVPSRLITLPAIPKSGSGKIDRNILVSNYTAEAATAAFVAAVTPTEKKLARIWEEVLQRDTMSAAQSFFEAGGHSLKAMRIISQLYQEFGVKAAIRDIFIHDTIQKLAVFVDGMAQENCKPISPADPAALYPLSPGQKSIWFASELGGAGAAYNLLNNRNWDMELDKPAFEKAWAALIERHESLRTVYVQQDGEVWQQVLDAADAIPAVEYFDCSEDDDEAKGKMMEIVNDGAIKYGFNLSAGPVVKLFAIKTHARQYHVVLAIHHIAADAWSLRVIERDLAELYAAFSTGRTPALTPLTIQYKDFAVWQYAEEQETARNYWLSRLSQGRPVLDFPADYRRPAMKSYRGEAVARFLPAEGLEPLLDFCRRHHCSLFSLLLTVVKSVICRYTGQSDILVGIPVADRERAELQDQVGYYVNTMPVASNIQGELSFEKMLEHVKSTLFEAFAYRDYPFDRLIDDLKLPRNNGHSPLFDFTVNFETGDDSYDVYDTPMINGRNVYDVTPADGKFDCSIFYKQFNNGMLEIITCNSDIFDAERFVRMSDHIFSFLRQVVVNPKLKIGSVDYMSAEEKQQLQQAFSNPHSAPVYADTVLTAFDAAVQCGPAAIAAVSGGTVLSYSELDVAANKLASYLVSRYKIGRGDRVAVVMDRNEKLVTALLAIAKTGAAYIPIDPNYPAGRRSYILEDSAAKLVIAEKQYSFSAAVPVLKWEPAYWYYSEDTAPAVTISGDDLVYIIYTSGSTGKPKGVMVSHSGLANLCQWHTEAFSLQPGCNSTMYAGIGFDASAWELWPVLYAGATVYPVPDEIRYDFTALQQFIAGNRITHSFLPTPVCEELFRKKIKLPENLCLLTGGDRLQVLPDYPVNLYNNYGPTEATVVATSIKVEPDGSHVIPIGRPISNTSVYILDEALQELPVGVYGELCIGGRGLAKGYVNNEALTAEKFVPNPFVPGEKMYRTGDFARWLNDGSIEFLGRKDRQVKIRGYRIEIGEIEQTMLRISGIENARVLSTDEGSPRLYGFYTGTATADEVTTALHAALPSYMVPAQCLAVPAFPLTANGKIDDSALLATIQRYSRSSDAEELLTATEAALALVWQEVLGISCPGRNDSFFEIGGHSMKAMQLLYAAETSMGARLTLRDIFNNPTLAAMAAFVDSNSTSTGLIINFGEPALFAPSLYMIPPITGSATVYADAAKKLAPAFNCKGLQYPGFEGEGTTCTSLQEMAARFFDEIMQDSTDETITLAGYSLGGLLAFETAKLLEKAGRKTSLVIIDRDVLVKREAEAADEDTINEVLNAELNQWAAPGGLLINDSIRALVKQNYQNLLAYRQEGKLRGSILAIRAAQGTQNMKDWKHYTEGGFSLAEVQATHYDILAAAELPQLLLGETVQEEA